MNINELQVQDNHLMAGVDKFPCVVGKAGIAADKREGDLRTPIGRFPLRSCYYRPDRVALPRTSLPLIPLSEQDGWCDDPAHPLYNQPVKLPFGASHEKLWREDHCYDLIIPLGYNDNPVIPGKGSAIFLHVMHDDGRATEGCVAVVKEALLRLLPRLSRETVLVVS